MAKRKNTRSTTRTTTTRSANGRTTTTMTTKNTSVPIRRRAARRPATQPAAQEEPAKDSGLGIIAGIVVILLLLALAYYFLTNQPLTAAQQSGQFATQSSAMQSDNHQLTSFYLSNAAAFHLPVNQSWAVDVTDVNSTGGTIGQLTVSWNGQTDTLSTQNGIAYTGISPTYAVTLTHSEFMSFSQAAITNDTAAALIDYSTYYLSGKLNYTRVS